MSEHTGWYLPRITFDSRREAVKYLNKLNPMPTQGWAKKNRKGKWFLELWYGKVPVCNRCSMTIDSCEC